MRTALGLALTLAWIGGLASLGLLLIHTGHWVPGVAIALLIAFGVKVKVKE